MAAEKGVLYLVKLSGKRVRVPRGGTRTRFPEFLWAFFNRWMKSNLTHRG
jgi:hypothetical protein